MPGLAGQPQHIRGQEQGNGGRGKTRPVTISIGTRRAPAPHNRPGVAPLMCHERPLRGGHIGDPTDRSWPGGATIATCHRPVYAT
jgi:hypothetical protein